MTDELQVKIHDTLNALTVPSALATINEQHCEGCDKFLTCKTGQQICKVKTGIDRTAKILKEIRSLIHNL